MRAMRAAVAEKVCSFGLTHVRSASSLTPFSFLFPLSPPSSSSSSSTSSSQHHHRGAGFACTFLRRHYKKDCVDVRQGQKIEKDNKLYEIVKFEHTRGMARQTGNVQVEEKKLKMCFADFLQHITDNFLLNYYE